MGVADEVHAPSFLLPSPVELYRKTWWGGESGARIQKVLLGGSREAQFPKVMNGKPFGKVHSPPHIYTSKENQMAFVVGAGTAINFETGGGGVSHPPPLKTVGPRDQLSGGSIL